MLNFFLSIFQMLNTSSIERSITKLKAAWRGKQTRSILLETRCEFEEIFNDIEQQYNTDSIIEWTSNNLCYPKIIDTKKCSTGNSKFNSRNKKDLDFENKKNREYNINENNTSDKIIKDDELRNSPAGNNSTKNEGSSIHPAVAESPSSEYITQLVNDMTEKVLTCNSASGSLETGDGMNNSPNNNENVSSNKNERRNTSDSGESMNEDSADQNTDSVELQFNGSLVDPLEFVETSSSLQSNKNTSNNKHNILTDSWVSDKSFDISPTSCSEDTTENKSGDKLLKMKENLSMELLWISQAITSRKAYLKMKNSS